MDNVVAKYQKYDEYKDSGFEWLGEIPVHWIVKKHKYIAEFTKGKNPEVLVDSYIQGLYPYLSMDSLRGKADCKYAEYNSGLMLVEDNQPLIIWDGSNSGEFVLGKKGILSSTMASSTLIYKVESKFYWYTCICIEPEMRKHATGMGIPHVNGEELRKITIPLPAFYEQQKIANFLDHETAKIDSLIEKQQKLIELLQEKRQAVISDLVRIKKDEKTIKLKFAVDILAGYSFSSLGFKTEAGNECSVPLLRGINVGVDSIKWNEVVWWSNTDTVGLDRYLLKEGDIVFGMDRPWISNGARVAEITKLDLPSYLVQRVARIRALKDFYQPYIKLVLTSREFKAFIESDLTGVSVPHISTDQIISYEVRNLTYEEQAQQTTKFVEFNYKIESLIVKAELVIQLMQERRTALISAAVTGKIDVRNWQAPDEELAVHTV